MNAQPTLPMTLSPLTEPAPDGWAAHTEVATRFVSRNEDQHDTARPLEQSIGKAVGPNIWEYFVSCAPSDALAQQFDVRMPTFVALHSLGEASSRRFLADVAQHMGQPVQRLVIRRQGFGTELAVLYFVDLLASNSQAVRLYSTDVRTDEATRYLLGKLLLSRSQMVALLVGEMPRPAMSSGIASVGQDVREGRRGSGALVVLPFVASTTLESATDRLVHQPGLQVRRAPRASRLLDAWPFLVSTWNSLHAGPKPDTPANELLLIQSPALPGALPPAAPSRPSVAVPPKAVEPTPLQRHLARYAQGVAGLKGVLSCCVFDARSMSLQAQSGASEPAVALMVRQGRTLIATMQASSQVLGLGKVVKESVIVLDNHQIMLGLVPGAPNMVLMVLRQAAADTEMSIFKTELNRLQLVFKAALAAG